MQQQYLIDVRNWFIIMRIVEQCRKNKKTK